MNIAEVLSARAIQMGDAPAIRDVRRGKERVISFAELDRRSAQAASLFVAKGLKSGDDVLVLHGMSIELYVVLIGLFRAGMVAMFLDPSAGLAHIKRCCDLQPPRGLVGLPKVYLLAFVSSALRRIPHRFVVGPQLPGTTSVSRADGYQPQTQVASVVPAAPALLTFTSGSTGRPKAAVRSHAFLLAQHRALEKSISLRPGEVDLTTLPVFVLANLGSGVTSIIANADLRRPGFIDPRPVLDQVRRLRPSRTAGSPAFYERLLDHLEKNPAEREGLPAVKVYTGGAPVFPVLLARLKTIFHVEPEAVYGSTEAEPIAHLANDEIHREDHIAMREGKGLVSGQPIPEIQLRVLSNQWGTPLGELSPLAFDALIRQSGEAGEIVVSGEHVLTAYLHGHGNEETKFTVAGVIWHRTGDLGYCDEQGRLWLLGRCTAIIQDVKGTLYPFAVECVARQFGWVRLAGCVGANGRRILALEVNRQPAGSELADLRESLGWAKLDDCVILDHLPVDKRHNAKVDYRALRSRTE